MNLGGEIGVKRLNGEISVDPLPFANMAYVGPTLLGLQQFIFFICICLFYLSLHLYVCCICLRVCPVILSVFKQSLGRSVRMS